MPTDHDIIADKLALAAKTGRADGLTIEYWIGGGQPPPYYRSEQLLVTSHDDRLTIDLAIMRFHPRLTPQEVLEVRTQTSYDEELKQLATELLATQFDVTVFEEESDPRIGSVISHQISVRFKKSELRKNYYRHLPAQFSAFEELSGKLTANAKEKGKRTWRHKGHDIPNPFNDLEE